LEKLNGTIADPSAIARADDTLADTFSQTKRITDRENDLTNLHLIGVSQRKWRHVSHIDLKHRDVNLLVAADNRGLSLPAVV
jgi:hypothetical protein